MSIAAIIALALTAQADVAPPEAPSANADTKVPGVVEVGVEMGVLGGGVGDEQPPPTMAPPPTTATPPPTSTASTASTACAPDPYVVTRTVLQAAASQGVERRATAAVTSGVVAAGLIGAGITYYAVSHADGDLSRLNAQDTEIAGFVIGGAAVIPIAAMVIQIVVPSSEEARLEAFDENSDHDAAVAAARADLRADADTVSWAKVGTGAALVVGGLGAGGLGAYFLLLPHLENPRGPVTHGTGAELIGGGVTALGVGVALLATSMSSTSSTQLELMTALSPE